MAAAASVIVDVTLGVVTQILFTLLGLVLLVLAFAVNVVFWRTGRRDALRTLGRG